MTVGGAEETARSANPMLRMFEVQMAFEEHPQDDCKGVWLVAGPQTSGKFSAVAYYFTKKLQNELKVPVGFIFATVGGTEAEPWTSSQAPETDPENVAVKQWIWQAITEYPTKKQQFITDFSVWLKAHNREDKPPTDPQAYAAPGISTAGWVPVKMPGPITGPGLPTYGVIWLRYEVTFAEGALAYYLSLIHI